MIDSILMVYSCISLLTRVYVCHRKIKQFCLEPSIKFIHFVRHERERKILVQTYSDELSVFATDGSNVATLFRYAKFISGGQLLCTVSQEVRAVCLAASLLAEHARYFTLPPFAPTRKTSQKMIFFLNLKETYELDIPKQGGAITGHLWRVQKTESNFSKGVYSFRKSRYRY